MSTACPDADLLVAFGEGRCSPREAETILAHVQGCELCTMLVAQMVEQQGEDSTHAALIDEVSDEVASHRLEIGETAGRYRVVSVVGEGAMGVVYEAHDPQLDRRVALKALKLDPDDPETRAMLTLEGQTLGQLQHPNVVPVFDIGRSGSGWFIAMEYVDGHSLRAWCEGKSCVEIVERFFEAAKGLAAAHRVGIVHRDFKPGNVLVGRDDRARVADFGIAVSKTFVPGESNTHSSEGETAEPPSTRPELIGTPAYMAPEQLMGEPASERSDQYAFFVALFEMLEGRRPFRGKSASALLEARRKGIPKLQRADVPRSLAEAIAQGLSFDAARRHASMQRVAQILAEVQRPRSRIGWSTAALAGLGALWLAVASRPTNPPCESTATAVEAAWRDTQRPSLRQRWNDAPAELNRVDYRLDEFVHRWVSDWSSSCRLPDPEAEAQQRCLKSALTTFEAGVEVLLEPGMAEAKMMDVAIGSAPSWTRCNESSGGATVQFASFVVDGWSARMMSLYRAERYDEVMAFFEDRAEAVELIGTPAKRAEIIATVGRAETFAADRMRGLERLETAHELAVGAGADDLAADISTTILTISSVLEPARAEKWRAHARADVERSSDAKVRARFHAAMGWYEIRHGREQSAAAEANAAAEAIAVGGSMPQLEWNVDSLRGHIALVARDYETCRRSFEAALDELGRWYGPMSVPTIQPRAGLVQCLLGTKNHHLASLTLDEQLDVLHRAGLDNGPRLDSLLLLRAATHVEAGDDVRAIELLEGLTDRLGMGHRSWAGAWNRLGNARARQGDHLGSRGVFERLRVYQEDKYGPQSVRLAITLHNLAEAESALGEYDAAVGHYQEAIDVAALHEDPGPLLAYALTGMGEVELARGNLTQARDLIERALAVPHDDRDERAEAKASLARTLWRIGDPKSQARALDLADEALAVFEATPGYQDHARDLERWRETL